MGVPHHSRGGGGARPRFHQRLEDFLIDEVHELSLLLATKSSRSRIAIPAELPAVRLMEGKRPARVELPPAHPVLDRLPRRQHQHADGPRSARNVSSTTQPSRLGSITSRTASSNVPTRRRCGASLPSPDVSTWKPSSRSPRADSSLWRRLDSETASSAGFIAARPPRMKGGPVGCAASALIDYRSRPRLRDASTITPALVQVQ